MNVRPGLGFKMKPVYNFHPPFIFIPMSFRMFYFEDSFSAKKAGAVFADLTAAYDTLWHLGLTCKLLRLLPDRHLVRMIMEMVGNRNFTLTTGNDKRSRLRHLKNGVPQESVLAPLLFIIYISDLPTTVSREYAHADDLATMHADRDDRQWKGC